MPELKLADVILRQRKMRNMTQEELAAALGVTAQAVSHWERGGYPDITMLPSIAHYFEITIDELLGNDANGIKKDIESFYERLWKLNSAERLKLALEYYRKYPNKYDIADTLIYVLSDGGFASAPEYYSLLREACTKVIENCADNEIRYNAIFAMSLFAEDSEADFWLDMTPQYYHNIRGEIISTRLKTQGRKEEMQMQNFKNNLSLMLHAVSKEPDADKSLEIFIGHYAYLRKLIHTFGENGEIPDGWLCKYAFITMKNAQGLFSSGRTDEGFELLEIAVNSYKKYFDLPDDTPLSLGAPAFFGDITVKKYTLDGKSDVYSDGIEASYYMQNPIYLYDILNGDSDCFADIRHDPRFLSTVTEAKKLADEFLKKRAK